MGEDVGAALVEVEVFPFPHLLSGDEKVPHGVLDDDDAPLLLHDVDVLDDLYDAEDGLCEGGGHGSCSSRISNLKQKC